MSGELQASLNGEDLSASSGGSEEVGQDHSDHLGKDFLSPAVYC